MMPLPGLDRDDVQEETKPIYSTVGLRKQLTRNQPVVSWTHEGREWSLALAERTIVGSSTGSGIVLRDPGVSRIHAELEPSDRGVWVRDLASRNGTFVEGMQIQSARVPDNTRVRVGSTELLIRIGVPAMPVELWETGRFGPLIGESVAMRELFAQLSRISDSDAGVMIRGETGTGKELVARAIHEASRRADNPFVIIDCAALAEPLLQDELFGHKKGAFTGALEARAGAFEAAHGGTVFLDEVGELPLSMQPKLLRVLESRTVRRLGEAHYHDIDVRVISATHRDLRKMVNAGAFREDLYFRLAVLPVHVPELRERREDIPALVKHFLPREAAGVPPELLHEVMHRPWLGNVRELRNFVERAVAFGPNRAIAMMTSSSPPPPMPSFASAGTVPSPASATLDSAIADSAFELDFKAFRERWLEIGERRYVQHLLAKWDGSVAAAAKATGINRTYLYRLIRKHGL
jgi:transcriptional regulator with GAF, ATPase, and Fis domain